MIPLILGLIGAYVIAEAYKRYATPEEKRKWENFAKTHHGEAGAILTATGVISQSPSLIGSGIGLMFHDRKDANDWFRK